MKKLRIAVDGPAGTGKSTVAKIVAKKLGIVYLDTGAMYRIASLVALQQETKEAAEIIDFIRLNPISFQLERVFLGSYDVTEKIRSAEVTALVSEIAALPEIRAFMTEEQRRIAANSSIIMDGRDIGTVVLPDAEVKIFLVADVHERALRRYKENQEKGIPSDLTEIEQAIATRDKHDSERKIAPLKQADDALRFDTTGRTIDEVVDFIIEKARLYL